MRYSLAAAGAAGLFLLSHASDIPVVQISNGTVQGSRSGTVDNFLGIPFAQPPVGELRFRPPLPVNTSFGILNATGLPRACAQLPQDVDPGTYQQIPASDFAPYSVFTEAPSDDGEDCLTLNIQRPAMATADSKLPVLFWIYGGGFNTGSTQSNDWAALVAESVSLGHPILVVQANYRLQAFGFLGGSEVQAEGSTNVGLRDQRLALKWVAENIAAFGGDPDRVTLWGESAGAVSSLSHMIIDGGDNTYNGKPLFRGAIMNSGSVFPAEPVNSTVAQATFDAVAKAGGCESGDRLACLRSLPYEKLINATGVAPSLFTYTGISISFPPRPDPNDSFYPVSPEKVIQSRRLARVPIITGNQADEGSLFALPTYHGHTTEQFIDKHLVYLYQTAPHDVLKTLINTYSTNPADGAPYGTGNSDQVYTNYKRNAAFLGDVMFIFQRRYQLEHTAGIMPTWSFLATYNQTSPTFGTSHGSDIVMYHNEFPMTPYKHSLQYYISFVNYLNPNSITKSGGPDLIQWPRYTRAGKEMIQFGFEGESTLVDDFRNFSYSYFKDHISQIKL